MIDTVVFKQWVSVDRNSHQASDEFVSLYEKLELFYLTLS